MGKRTTRAAGTLARGLALRFAPTTPYREVLPGESVV